MVTLGSVSFSSPIGPEQMHEKQKSGTVEEIHENYRPE